MSLEKDVLVSKDAVVNRDSGHLALGEVQKVIRAFANAARGNLAGMDVLGDWSEVNLQGAFRRLLHVAEHPPLAVEPDAASERNEAVNLALLRTACDVTQPWYERVLSRRAA